MRSANRKRKLKSQSQKTQRKILRWMKPAKARVRPRRRPVLELRRINPLLAISPRHKVRQHLEVHGETEKKPAETIKTAMPKRDLSQVVDFASAMAFGSTPPTISPKQS